MVNGINNRQALWVVFLSMAGFAVHFAALAGEVPQLAVIKSDVQTRFSNGGWKYDRYKDLPSLDAKSRMTIADLEGPGVIRHVHVTRHAPEERASRGVVLEIRFDDADQPAVMCPLADFFGDGCNGRSMDFTSLFIECAPWNYNCYFAMPFKRRAQVVLRNDTDKDIMNYSYVEWESLPEWNDEWGYFHATYSRKCFQLTKQTDEVFFEVKGKGHVIGRQFSVVTDEPIFRAYNVVMEGNNEVDVDGRRRAIDYLGTECSFGFCWGFRSPFAGLRCGMTLVQQPKANANGPAAALNRLSVYRFHDQMPIRFNRSLKWHVNWQHERFFTARPEWAEAVEKGGCWVDYATVHYWYQTTPGGFQHTPLPPVADRRKPMLRPVAATTEATSEEAAKDGDAP
ncbi:MAG: DUF2961 domain-containing protein [Planctomycetota bacterium]|jgi:hypothetical protein